MKLRAKTKLLEVGFMLRITLLLCEILLCMIFYLFLVLGSCENLVLRQFPEVRTLPFKTIPVWSGKVELN